MKRLFAACLLLSILLTGCYQKKDIPVNGDSSLDSSNPSSEANSSDPGVVKKAPANPFTGVAVSEDELLNRPVAVMINNIDAALPQSGIGSADVVFEMPVEGSATRLMAVFADNKKLPTVGSVRSSRHDFVEIIKPFDPLYVHFGYSDSAKATIEKENISNINGIQIANIAFYQDKVKLTQKASEHTWFANYDTFSKGVENKQYETKLTEPLEPMFTFAEGAAMDAYADAVATTNAVIKYSGGASAGFEYNSATGKYKKFQNGKPHIDEALGNEPAEYKNVLVMYTNVGLMADGKHKEIDLSSGKGYYISDGKRIDVTFKKLDINSYLRVYDATGAELAMNVGNTWVCVAPNDMQSKEALS